MVYLNKNIISAKEAEQFLEHYEEQMYRLESDQNIIIDKILKEIQKNSKHKFKKDSEYSYFKIERKPDGHEPHYDTGSNQHMNWCDYSASILLSNPDLIYSGGVVHFKNKIIRPEQHYLTCVNYRSNEKENLNKHFVTSHRGTRIVLLIFLECD